jgi:hypothetical protein
MCIITGTGGGQVCCVLAFVCVFKRSVNELKVLSNVTYTVRDVILDIICITSMPIWQRPLLLTTTGQWQRHLADYHGYDGVIRSTHITNVQECMLNQSI